MAISRIYKYLFVTVLEQADLLGALYIMAQASPHKEICGLVSCNNTSGLMEIIPIKNVAASGDQFVLEKAGFFRALNRLKVEGTKVFCIFHSHPNGNEQPSECDVKSARATGYNYLIVTTNKYSWVDI